MINTSSRPCGVLAPDLRNQCSLEVGHVYEIPRAAVFSPVTPVVTYAGNIITSVNTNIGDRLALCKQLGIEWDWTGRESERDTQSNNCDRYTEFPRGLNCGTCRSIPGSTVKCTRNGFYGRKLPCCFKDQSCNQDPTACFVSFEPTTVTCPPEFRDVTQGECADTIMKWCTGLNEDGIPEPGIAWTSRWTGTVDQVSQPCVRALYRNLYANNPNKLVRCQTQILPDHPFESQGFNYSQNLFEAMVQRYVDQGGRLEASEGTPGALTVLNPLIRQICSETPGLCQRALFKYCATQTVEAISRNPNALSVCGCYLPNEQYAKYTDVYQINRECTPTCNVDGVIPLPSNDSTGTKICEQSTCVIDNASLNVIAATGGNISFDQICSSCASGVTGGTGTCNCNLTGLNFTSVGSRIPNFDISQACGSDTRCY